MDWKTILIIVTVMAAVAYAAIIWYYATIELPRRKGEGTSHPTHPKQHSLGHGGKRKP